MRGDLAAVDADEPEQLEPLIEGLPETAWQKSGSRTCKHYFLFVPGLDDDLPLVDPDTGDELGHINAAEQSYVIGPGSKHPHRKPIWTATRRRNEFTAAPPITASPTPAGLSRSRWSLGAPSRVAWLATRRQPARATAEGGQSTRLVRTAYLSARSTAVATARAFSASGSET